MAPRNNNYILIEAFAGKYQCEGNYAFNTVVRCPEYGSIRVDEGYTIMMYD
jgi:hypothetical protein